MLKRSIRVATVGEKSGKNKNVSRSGKSQGILQKVRENLRSKVCKSQWKVRELYFLSEKYHVELSIWVTFAGIVVLISGFQCFFIIHLAYLWSVKIVQKSRNSSASDEWQPYLLIGYGELRCWSVSVYVNRLCSLISDVSGLFPSEMIFMLFLHWSNALQRQSSCLTLDGQVNCTHTLIRHIGSVAFGANKTGRVYNSQSKMLEHVKHQVRTEIGPQTKTNAKFQPNRWGTVAATFWFFFENCRVWLLKMWCHTVYRHWCIFAIKTKAVSLSFKGALRYKSTKWRDIAANPFSRLQSLVWLRCPWFSSTHLM